MDGSFLNNFALPEAATEALARGSREVSVTDGVSRYYSGTHKGVAYRFFYTEIYNERKSKEAKYPVFDQVEMVEWIVDKDTKPVERVRLLPEELLSISEFTGEVSGAFAESYRRFKAGQEAPGTPLRNWGVLASNWVATLEKLGIFTVEQFAETPRNKVLQFPEVVQEGWQRAQHEAGNKDSKQAADRLAKELVALKDELAALKAAQSPKKGGKKAKAETIVTADGEIEV